MKKETPLSVRFLQIALAFIALILGYFAYLIFQPAPQVNVNQPIVLDTRNVAPGQRVTLKVKYCADEAFTQKLDIQLVLPERNGSAITLYSIDEASVLKGCNDTDIQVDSDTFKAFSIRDGEYQLRMRTTTKVNVIKYEINRYTSETFKYTRE